jgi:four helix bundle protein
MKNAHFNKMDLEERLIDYAVRSIKVAEELPNTTAGKHLNGQLTRSGTSPALNYAEAQSAESGQDFVHKMKICLKELRETMVCLKIVKKLEYFKSERLDPILKENNELISIFVKSIETAKINIEAEKRQYKARPS